MIATTTRHLLITALAGCAFGHRLGSSLISSRGMVATAEKIAPLDEEKGTGNETTTRGAISHAGGRRAEITCGFGPMNEIQVR